MRHVVHVLSLAVLLSSSLLAQGIEDALVIGSRGSRTYLKISRGAEVLKTQASSPSRSLRGCARAPDGKIWVVNFIQANFTVLKPALTLFKDVTGISGNPSSIVFSRMDSKGNYNAYVVLNNTNEVLVYDQSVTQVGKAIKITTATTHRALGGAVDLLGNLWVGMRANSAAPGQLYKVVFRPTQKVLGPFALASTASFGGRVFCTKLNVFSFGDRSRELFKFDLAGKPVGKPLVLGAASSGLADAAIDASDTMWITDYGNGSLYQVATQTMTLVKAHKHARMTSGFSVAIDGEGGIWVLQRGTPSWLALKFDTSGTLLTTAPIGLTTQGLDDFTGYDYARVVDPGGDNDGDGLANLAELTGGTNPFHAQSNTDTSLDLAGPAFLGQTVTVTLKHTIGAAVGLQLFGSRAPIPVSVPILKGSLYLQLPLLFTGPAQAVSPTMPLVLKAGIPNDPTIVGLALLAQGMVTSGTGPPLHLSEPESVVLQK